MKRYPGVAWLVAGMVLVPYTTVLLPFQFGLRLQAALIVAAVGIAASGGRRELLQPGRLLPGPILVGLSLYAGAAAWGAAVGVLAGNPTRFVASQLLSMVLLPAAALAFAARRDLDGETLVRALGLALVLALVLHLEALVAPQLAGEVPGHFGFDLRNGIGAGGLAPLVWLLGLSWVCAGLRPWSAVVPAGTAAILCLWAQSRGGWVAALIGTAAILLLMDRRPARTVLLASGMVLVLVAVAAVGWIPATGSDGRLGPLPVAGSSALLRLESSDATATEREATTVRPFEGAALKISSRMSGERGSHLWAWADFADSSGRFLGRRWLEIVGTGRWTNWASLLAAPPAARAVRAGFRVNPNQGTWLVDGVSLSVVRSQIEGLRRQLCLRALTLGRALADPAADSALNYRMAEAHAVDDVWSRAGLARRLAGFGLGATFAFPNASFNDEGGRIVLPVASYIHDFYLFLLFKLGLAGAVAFAGFLLIAGWTARSAVALRGRPESQWLFAGAAAGWLAYLVWSVTSPEIYDFRFAPLWGVLIAACSREAGGEQGVMPDDGSARAERPARLSARQAPRRLRFPENGRPR